MCENVVLREFAVAGLLDLHFIAGVCCFHLCCIRCARQRENCELANNIMHVHSKSDPKVEKYEKPCGCMVMNCLLRTKCDQVKYICTQFSRELNFLKSQAKLFFAQGIILLSLCFFVTTLKFYS